MLNKIKIFKLLITSQMFSGTYGDISTSGSRGPEGRPGRIS